MNLLQAIKDIQPTTVYVKLGTDVNPISWIFTHCLGHLVKYLEFFEDLRNDAIVSPVFEEDLLHYTQTGVDTADLPQTLPLPFNRVVAIFLHCSSKFHTHISQLTDLNLKSNPDNHPETWSQVLQRISLHFMGHAGQISLIRKQIEANSYSFVMGIKETQLVEMKLAWMQWWDQYKGIYD